MLACLQVVEGGYMTVKKLGGWESLDCELRGHTTGHLLSAYGLMYAATGSEQFKQKGDSLVNGLAEVQTALGNGYLSAYRPTRLLCCFAKFEANSDIVFLSTCRFCNSSVVSLIFSIFIILHILILNLKFQD